MFSVKSYQVVEDYSTSFFFSCSVLALGWSLAVNWYYYQKVMYTTLLLANFSNLLQVVFVQWRFFVFNVWKGHSALYGTHPWHWYKIATATLTNPPHACTVRVTVLGLCVCLSVCPRLILTLQETARYTQFNTLTFLYVTLATMT